MKFEAKQVHQHREQALLLRQRAREERDHAERSARYLEALADEKDRIADALEQRAREPCP